MARDAPNRTWRAVAGAASSGRPPPAGPLRDGEDAREQPVTGEGETTASVERVPMGENPGGTRGEGAETDAGQEPADPWADFYRGKENNHNEWRDDEWNTGWESGSHWREGWHDWQPFSGQPLPPDRRSSLHSASTGCLSDRQLREFYTSAVGETTALDGGRWIGTRRWEAPVPESFGVPAWLPDGRAQDSARPTEKIAVPEFAGEGNVDEVGMEARSYIRRVQVWLRCTKLPPHQRGLALYSALKGKAWIYSEEMDVDILAGENGVTYFLEWVRARFMEMEVSKITQMMNELFKRCKRRSDQPVREFNVEFERLVLRLHEVRCELPPLVKAWLYLDKLRLTEQEEISLLASVGNDYDVRRLQQAAMIQDRGYRRGAGEPGGGGLRGTGRGGRWLGRQTAHVTAHGAEDSDSGGTGDGSEGEESDDALVDEATAQEHHSAFMAYQAAKDKYRAAVKGRGTDASEMKRRSEERLRQAKARSYCGACKRRGHWHKDPECPLRGKAAPSPAGAAAQAGKPQQAQICNQVFMTRRLAEDGGGTRNGPARFDDGILADPAEVIEGRFYKDAGGLDGKFAGTGPKRADGHQTGGRGRQGRGENSPEMQAIVDTACTRAVAGYRWFEGYCAQMDKLGIEVWTRDHVDHFKFGASRVHVSKFSVQAWFAIRGRWFLADIAVVPCEVPLLFSRPVLACLEMRFDLATRLVDLPALGLTGLTMELGPTGHPVLDVSQFPSEKPPAAKVPSFDVMWCPTACAYMGSTSPFAQAPPSPPGPARAVFYPKKVAPEVHNLLVGDWLCGGQAFVAWWKGANQSRDFWLETAGELIRVHVVPRKRSFDPSLWTTKHTELKGELLKRLGLERRTEAIPCLVEGVAVIEHVCLWGQQESDAHRREATDLARIGLWIGRSRFPKQAHQRGSPELPIRDFDVPPEVRMEDEQVRADGRAGGLPGVGPPHLDGARAAQPGSRAAPDEGAGGAAQPRRDGPDGRDLQDDLGAAGVGGAEAECHSAAPAHQRPGDETAARREHHREHHCHAVRQVQELVLQGGAAGLPGVGGPGGEEGQQPPGPAALCHLGGQGDGGAGPEEEQGGPQTRGLCGPGGDRAHAAAQSHDRASTSPRGKQGEQLGRLG